ncbi:MAG TPA: hypothetical protein VN682_21015 [Terriglobales bacterium]|nr:hypothetical protein [Terriglobales bacterium]
MKVKRALHISGAEAANDFPALLDRVRSGAEIVIEHDARPVVVLHAAEPVRRTISECIAPAKVHEEESGSAPSSTRTSQPTWKKFSLTVSVESASEGVILDSSILIMAERRGCSVRQIWNR